jgi:ribosomal protein S18 acetylase RimI-like enzyme
MIIRKTEPYDLPGIFRLYKGVAENAGGIARLADEVSEEYVESFVSKTIATGVGFVAVDSESTIVAEIHAYSPGIFCFSHVLSDLTIVVDPQFQGTGAGRVIFETLLYTVADERPDISRVELIGRESNEKALKFYESLGFVREGILRGRIKNLDGTIESDIPMAWSRESTPESRPQ